MEIKLIDNKEPWDGWLQNSNQHNVLAQSWEWGNILLAEGKQVERLAVMDGETILAQAQVVYSSLPFGWQYAFCPQGPMESSKFKVESYKVLTQYLKNKNCIFLRVEPETILPAPHSLLFKKTIDINPSATLILDLNKSEEQILAGMHQKTRYNIHLAEKKDLKISQEKKLETFWQLMNQTGSRDKFSLHHKVHYEKVLQSPAVLQLTAYAGVVPVAVAVFIQFGNTLTYLYGASDYAHRDLMAPYLLQWEGIKIGKSFGCQLYDFFGIAPVAEGNYDKNHQYAGVTRFKLGFGGQPQQSAGTWDVVIDSRKYRVYNFLRKLRRLV